MCCGGSCSFPEETGEEQEVLLRSEKREEPYQKGVCCGMNCFQMTDSAHPM